MLEWNIFVLDKARIKNVIIAVKYLGDQIISYVDRVIRPKFPHMNFHVPKDLEPKDTADALRHLKYLIPDTCKRFFITMADIVTNIDLTEMARFHKEKKGFVTISLKNIDGPRSFGVIVLDDNSQILLFLEKPSPQELYMTTLMFRRRKSISYHANLVNTGIYLFEREILTLLTDFQDLMDFGKQVFPFLLERRQKIFGYFPSSGRQDYYWMDCGTAEKLLWCNWDVLRRWAWPYLPKGSERDGSWFGKDVRIGKNVKIASQVVIGDDVELNDNVEIRSLASIGNGCRIGNNSVVEGAVIDVGAQIGENATLIRCYVGANSIIGKGSTIGENSVIGEKSILKSETHLPAGSVIE